MNKIAPIIATVGLCGAGKSEVVNILTKLGFKSVYFGQATFDEMELRGLPVNETNERLIREGLRRKHGMAAFAKLNIPTIDKLHSAGKKILIDGLYSWAEYKVLKKKYGPSMTVVAVYAPPEVRYERLSNRQSKHAGKTDKRYRSIPRLDAIQRDYSEIENIEKAGPIAMADYTLINTGTLKELNDSVKAIHKSILSVS